MVGQFAGLESFAYLLHFVVNKKIATQSFKGENQDTRNFSAGICMHASDHWLLWSESFDTHAHKGKFVLKAQTCW
jgi:hypothetical protein